MKKDIQPSYGEAVVIRSSRAGRSWWTAADGSIASRSGTACKLPLYPLQLNSTKVDLPFFGRFSFSTDSKYFKS